MKKFGKSRYDLYMELDKPALIPLPEQRYEFREFKYCLVNVDYHVEVDGCYYSVPYQLSGKEVECYYTVHSIEIYFSGKRVALHRRMQKRGACSTEKEHMAAAHRAYADVSPSKLLSWANNFGPNTGRLIETIMQEKPHPEMGFRTARGILVTAQKHSDVEAVELTALKMLDLKSYRVAHFQSILKNKAYLSNEVDSSLEPLYHENLPTIPPANENVRGATYYR